MVCESDCLCLSLNGTMSLATDTILIASQASECCLGIAEDTPDNTDLAALSASVGSDFPFSLRLARSGRT